MPHNADDHQTLRKKDLAELLASRLGLSKALGKAAAQLMLDEIVAKLVAGGRVEFRDCFVLETREVAPRAVRNPHTGELATTPRRRTVRVKPGRRLREALQEGCASETACSGTRSLRLVGAAEASRNGRPASEAAGQRRGGS